jgi:hypothetical protein
MTRFPENKTSGILKILAIRVQISANLCSSVKSVIYSLPSVVNVLIDSL